MGSGTNQPKKTLNPDGSLTTVTPPQCIQARDLQERISKNLSIPTNIRLDPTAGERLLYGPGGAGHDPGDEH